METVIKQDIGGNISTYHYKEDESIATASELSSTSFQLIDPFGTVIKDTTSLTPAADGLMTAVINADDSGTLWDYARAHFQYTFDGQIKTQNVYFHVAKTEFDLPSHFEDLIAQYPDLEDMAAGSNDPRYGALRQQALDFLYDYLQGAGWPPWKLLNLHALTTVFKELWLWRVWLLHSKSSPAFLEFADSHKTNFYDMVKQVKIIEDKAEDANIGDQEAIRTTQVRVQRG